jgi:amino acid adenylation domain-containing protein
MEIIRMLISPNIGQVPLPTVRRIASPLQRTVVYDLFVAQTQRSPSAPAIWHEGETFTYEDLDQWSNGIANLLVENDVKPDVPVAIAMQRSPAQIAAILGILKSGGAYVPVDLAYPAARVSAILESANASIVLTDEKHAARFRNPETEVIAITGNERAPVAPRHTATPRDLAYIIYTSGSTGKPKGVAMPHGPLLNLIQWQCHESADLPHRARTLQFSSISFDVSFQEIFSTLGSGGTLVLVSDEMRRDSDDLWRFLCVAEVNRIFLPFVALQQLADAAARSHRTADALREIITAGEQLRVTPQLKSLMQRLPGCRLENQYGPTETHVVTAYTMPADIRNWPSMPPIGREIPGVEIVILDDRMQPVKAGQSGELYIAGDCLARGYMHRPDLTAERFIASPLPEQLVRRLYRTGDLARRVADGEIEFLGRTDDQVKVRGYRI